jgi:hypothetical protein
MHALPFDQPGRFYRGNLHTHTLRSDGQLAPQDVCKFYHDVGYHFVALTDHFMERYSYPITESSIYQQPDFITLTGAELHSGETSYSGLWHILAVGLPADFATNLPGETGPQIASRAMQAGAYVACAHPAWYNLCEADVVSLGAIDAIEIFNGISLDHNDRGDSCYMLDALLAQGHRYLACATDDAHFHPRHADVMRGWVQVKSEALTHEAILAALKAGHYYSSTGPVLRDIEVDAGDKIIVRCSPVQHIFVTGRGSVARQIHGNNLIEGELDISRLDSPYCRITVRDEYGGRAWSNPIWF